MDPYASGLISKSPYGSKRIIHASIVAILQLNMDNRGLKLIQPQSRVLKKNEIHELIVTDERDAGPGTIVNSVAYVAFIEIQIGGVMVVGDEVYCNKILLGTVAGFDDTYAQSPKYVLYSPKRITGKELNISLEDPVIINAKKED